MNSKDVKEFSSDDTFKVNNILRSIASEGQKLNTSNSARERLIDYARDLIFALETPLEAILWTIWAEYINGVDAFSWLNQRPQIFGAFHEYLHGQREDRPAWVDEGFYPVKERLIDGLQLDGDRSAIVDIGGGAGQSLEEFRSAVPEWEGRLVLQEQQPVIDYASTTGLNERIELTAHDFFKEQPIKGARAYYLRSILHDWSDDCCLQILARVKEAMEPGYSRILINDHMLEDQGATWEQASLDLFMMALASSQERTETEWRTLLAKTGLEIKGIWSKGRGNESIIELGT